MRAEPSGRALRSMVAELAELADDDVDAILADLDPVGRAQLLELLKSYRAGAGGAPSPEASPISDWLDRRLAASGTAGLTPHARDAVLRVQGRMSPPPGPGSAPSPAPRGVVALLRGGR